jgi:hypothetical protein
MGVIKFSLWSCLAALAIFIGMGFPSFYLFKINILFVPGIYFTKALMDATLIPDTQGTYVTCYHVITIVWLLLMGGILVALYRRAKQKHDGQTGTT